MSDEDDVMINVSEELVELVPDLIWAVVGAGQGRPDLHQQPSENLVMPRLRQETASPSFIETMFILILIHIMFEYIR